MNLKFEYIIIFLNSYKPQIGTQSYIYHNIRKYIWSYIANCYKKIFLFSTYVKENELGKLIQEIVIQI